MVIDIVVVSFVVTFVPIIVNVIAFVSSIARNYYSYSSPHHKYLFFVPFCYIFLLLLLLLSLFMFLLVILLSCSLLLFFLLGLLPLSFTASIHNQKYAAANVVLALLLLCIMACCFGCLGGFQCQGRCY